MKARRNALYFSYELLESLYLGSEISLSCAKLRSGNAVCDG